MSKSNSNEKVPTVDSWQPRIEGQQPGTISPPQPPTIVREIVTVPAPSSPSISWFSQFFTKVAQFKMVRFTRELVTFYFADFRVSFRSAWRVALEISGGLSLVIPAIVFLLRLVASKEAILLNLVWQIPLCFLLVFLGLILLRGPFLRYQKLQKELEEARAPNETESTLRGQFMLLETKLKEVLEPKLRIKYEAREPFIDRYPLRDGEGVLHRVKIETSVEGVVRLKVEEVRMGGRAYANIYLRPHGKPGRNQTDLPANSSWFWDVVEKRPEHDFLLLIPADTEHERNLGRENEFRIIATNQNANIPVSNIVRVRLNEANEIDFQLEADPEYQAALRNMEIRNG